MTKSQVNALLHVMHGIFADIRAAYPALKGLSQDIERTALYCRERGLGFFTLDLPNLESALVQALENGSLVLTGPLSKAVSSKVRVPRLFSGLWLLVFDKDACLRPEPDINAIFFLRQLCCLGKRIEVDPTPDRVIATVRKFHDVERCLRPPTNDWSSDKLRFDYRSEQLHLGEASQDALPLYTTPESEISEAFKTEEDRYVLGRVQQVADLVLHALPFIEPLRFSAALEQEGLGVGFKHGPGAVSERLKNPEKSGFPNWPDKLERVFPYAYCGKTAGNTGERPLNHEVPSRLICVPKTAKGPRLIAAEPVAHQWCQQLVWRWLEDNMRSLFYRKGRQWFVDFRKQSASGDLVLQASLDRKLATVDLSDASDRLTCWTVERMFRVNRPLLYALHAARTRYLRDDISEDGSSFIKLKKFASQGTAVTFPVQSLVFLCIALGASIEDGTAVTWDSIWKLRRQVRVYGDDIIIPVHGYARLVRIMELLQLKVNKDKSFVKGHFRESCGVDGFQGSDITPVKPKTLVADGPPSVQAIIDTSNNLFNKGLWHASRSVESLLPLRIRRRLRVVANSDGGFQGLTSFSGSDESHLERRWNSRLHRDEVRVFRLSGRTQKRPREGWSPLLDFFAQVHNPSQARTVSEYGAVRHLRTEVVWEPSNHCARDHA